MNFSPPQRFAWLRQICVIATAAIVAGCGGGSGEDTGTTPSTTANARLSFSQVKTTSGSVTTTYEAATAMIDFGARAHLTDVGPLPDSPGKGTTIMVIDDFSSSHASTTTLPLITRTINAQSSTERYTATYQVPYQIDTSFTHGDLVSNIAGGYGQTPASTLTLKVPTGNTSDLISCTRSYQATQLNCPTTFTPARPAPPARPGGKAPGPAFH